MRVRRVRRSAGRLDVAAGVGARKIAGDAGERGRVGVAGVRREVTRDGDL